MRRAVLIALLSCIYLGCAGHRDAPRDLASGPGPHGDGSIRVALPTAAIPDDPRVVAVPQGSGDADIAVLYGEPALDGSREVVLERRPAWDRTYGLWLNPAARWTHDPTFRRWVAATVDRDGIVDLLFPGVGVPAGSMIGDATPDTTRPATRPFSAGATPRLILVYDRTDPAAAAVASRVKADLERYGPIVEVRAEAVAPHDLPSDRRAPSAVVVAHPSATFDPWPGDEPAVRADDRLVPLVRVHAWSAVRAGLAGVAWGGAGSVSLADARWAR